MAIAEINVSIEIGGATPTSYIRGCCNELQQNAKSIPPCGPEALL